MTLTWVISAATVAGVIACAFALHNAVDLVRETRRARESPAKCPTECDSDCDQPCHEVHHVLWKRQHAPEDCPSLLPAPLSMTTSERTGARYVYLRDSGIVRTVALSDAVMVDLDENGEAVGVEIL